MLSVVKGGGGGGSRSRVTENKMVLSQFTKDKDLMKITVHGKLNIILFLISRILQNHTSRLPIGNQDLRGKN